MGEKIKVTPEYLQQKKGEWNSVLASAEKVFLTADKSMKELETVFSGKPVETLKRAFLVQSENGKTAFEMLKKQIDKLEIIAAVYQQTERSNGDFIREN